MKKANPSVKTFIIAIKLEKKLF